MNKFLEERKYEKVAGALVCGPPGRTTSGVSFRFMIFQLIATQTDFAAIPTAAGSPEGLEEVK